MTARHWIRIVTLTSALAVIDVPLAQNTERGTRADDESGVATYGTEARSAGAIVTPEDKALGMGKEDARAGDRDGHVDRDTSTSNDETPSVNRVPSTDEMSVNPGPSSDDTLSVNPGPSSDDMSVKPGPSSGDTLNVNPDRDDTDDILPPERRPAPSRSLGTRDNTSRIDEGSSTGSEMHRGDMGHGDLRAE